MIDPDEHRPPDAPLGILPRRIDDTAERVAVLIGGARILLLITVLMMVFGL